MLNGTINDLSENRFYFKPLFLREPKILSLKHLLDILTMFWKETYLNG